METTKSGEVEAVSEVYSSLGAGAPVVGGVIKGAG